MAHPTEDQLAAILAKLTDIETILTSCEGYLETIAENTAPA